MDRLTLTTRALSLTMCTYHDGQGLSPLAIWWAYTPMTTHSEHATLSFLGSLVAH